MKKIYSILLVALIIVATLSCTRNNGDIGDYFVTWKLEKMTINGSVDAQYEGNVFWAFQSQVICMKRVDNAVHTYTDGWGEWEEKGKVLEFNFFGTDNDNPNPGSPKYSPLPETHLPKGVSLLDVLSLSGSKMELRYISDDSCEIRYYLKKW